MRRVSGPMSPSLGSLGRRKTTQRGFWLSVGGIAAVFILLVQLSVRTKSSKWSVPDSIREKYVGMIGQEAKTEETYTVINIQNDTIHDATIIFDDTSMWKGFGSLEKLFIFGDSYSDTFFEPFLEQPSDDKPMGNNGPNGGSWVQQTRWPVYLTTKYNDSLLHTYNFAKAGAMVSREIIKNTGSLGMAMIEQFEDLFKPAYVDYNMETDDWAPDKSLFIIFIGINDNVRMFEKKTWNGDPNMQPQILHQHQIFMNKLYDVGARNFLIINLPPLDKYPIGRNKHGLSKSVQSWNAALKSYAHEFRTTRPLSTVIEYDANAFIDSVRTDPKQYRQTSRFKNTTDFCAGFGGEFDVVENKILRDSRVDDCEFALDEYLFIDSVHVTWPLHEAMAEQIAKTLKQYKAPQVNMKQEGAKHIAGG